MRYRSYRSRGRRGRRRGRKLYARMSRGGYRI